MKPSDLRRLRRGVLRASDLFAGRDKPTPPDDVIERRENDKYYRWIPFLSLPIQYAGFVGAFAVVAMSMLILIVSSGRT